MQPTNPLGQELQRQTDWVADMSLKVSDLVPSSLHLTLVGGQEHPDSANVVIDSNVTGSDHLMS